MPCSATARPLGIFPNGSSGQDHRWSFVTFEMSPTIRGSTGSTRNAFSLPVTSMNGCGKAGNHFFLGNRPNAALLVLRSQLVKYALGVVVAVLKLADPFPVP